MSEFSDRIGTAVYRGTGDPCIVFKAPKDYELQIYPESHVLVIPLKPRPDRPIEVWPRVEFPKYFAFTPDPN